MGAYHGKHGFLAFSHAKPVLEKMGADPSIRFPPYTPGKLSKMRLASKLDFNVRLNKPLIFATLLLVVAAVFQKSLRSLL
jgi:hypothetical protein